MSSSTRTNSNTKRSTLKPRSRDVTDGIEKAAARGMLRGVGLDDADFDKPQIGIGSSWNEITPCNLSLQRLAAAAKEGVRESSGVALEFGTISVSDGISMGHNGMHYSLVSREVIADSVETVVEAERLDGTVLFAGCDKSLPGMMMAAARLGLASVFVYAGTSLPGLARMLDGTDREVTIIDAFEAIGACQAGKIERGDVDAIERSYCPGEGACAGMYTANTMASMGEALGLSLPGSASPPAVDKRRTVVARDSGTAVMEMIRNGMTVRDVLTREAFENAITVLMSLGGSTNAVLHLLAIANEANVSLTLNDFGAISDRTPLLSDVKPFGRHVMRDVDRVGGIPVIMRALLDADLLHGDCLTVTGRTVAENLEDIDPPSPDGKVLYTTGKPYRATGGLTILRGTLAPDGAVAKAAGFSYEKFDGTARVFEGERECLDALSTGEITANTAVIIRGEGPKGGPGMREMLAVTGAIKGAGLGTTTLLITDGRFSGGTTGNCVAHVAPEAASGGPIDLVRDGDTIKLNLNERRLDLEVDKSELLVRSANRVAHKSSSRGVLAKYAALVGTASKGAVCLPSNHV